MCFLSRFLHYIWWLRKYYKIMVDYDCYQDGWLQEATLFPAEPGDYALNLDELLSEAGKANIEVGLALDVDLPDWFDTKVDLSAFDVPPEQPFELFDLLDNNLDASNLSSQNKNEFDNSLLEEQSTIFPEITGIPLQLSPYYGSMFAAGSPSTSAANSPSISAANSPASSSLDHTDFEFCSSPGGLSSSSSVNDGMYESISEAGSPASSSLANGIVDSPPIISVTVCNDDSSSSHSVEKAVSIDEITNSVRERKYIPKGEEIPKVQVSLKNVFHPYSKVTSKRTNGKYERKKVQNKEAAARYRIKKRMEEQGLSSDVSILESEQKELQKKHDALADEIKYLKKLMREVLQKKGVLK